jgi:hypothetical protein
MRITNAAGLPEVLVDAVYNDSYDPGEKVDMSVTTILQPPRKIALEREMGGELVEDASDRIWALMGQSIHTILERADAPYIPAILRVVAAGVKGSMSIDDVLHALKKPLEMARLHRSDRIVERRFYGEIASWKISGQVDVIEDHVLSDYKMMSVWEIIYGLKEEKVMQLNILRWLAEGEGVSIRKIQIVGILRDFQLSKAKYDPNYPQHQVQVVEVPLLPKEAVEDYLKTAINNHKSARFELPECTDEERWYSGDKYAVMKAGRKSALRVLDTKEEAERWMSANPEKKGDSIDYRPGENKRCDNYCAVSEFCRSHMEENGLVWPNGAAKNKDSGVPGVREG